MNFLRDLLRTMQDIFSIIWYLIIIALFLLFIPILFFLPLSVTKNFDQIVTRIALKILRFTWRVIKWSFFIALGLVLIVLTPVLIIWARLCGTLWAWVVSGGKPTLETKKWVYAALAVFGFFLMVIFGILGLVIACIRRELIIVPIIGFEAGFLLWVLPTRDCFDLHEEIKKELYLANHPYLYFNSSSSRNVHFTVNSSAPPPECMKDSDPASPPPSSSESGSGKNAPRS